MTLMFENLTAPEPDPIIRLMGAFAADERAGKVDLGVGVYRTPEGITPVMAAVKQAEERTWQTQTTKGYVALRGDPAFLDALRGLVLGEAVDAARVAACATPGGTGAVRQVFELTRRLAKGATVWLPDPSWPNHAAILDHLGQTWRSYRYYDSRTGGLDREGLRADLAHMAKGDMLLLHGCCHNPTGADLRPEDWAEVLGLCQHTGAIPFIDLAYLGFADGLELDAHGVRFLAQHLPEVIVAVSCSKNFGLYRDRVGACFVVTGEGKPRAAADGLLEALNRQNYAFPPDHGACVVETILSDPGLQHLWRDELGTMRETMAANRQALAVALRTATGSDRFGFLNDHKGMFSRLGATPEHVKRLREEHAIYMVGDGRMNVAGLTPNTIPHVAKAITETLC